MRTKSEHQFEKWEVEVQVELDNGTQLLGCLFVMPLQQRISDLLSDERGFLPFRSSDGLTHHLRKSSIARVVELEQDIDHDSITDPYEIMGLPRHVSDDELARTYHDLCRLHHPDKLVSLDLPKEHVAIAHSRTVRIIDAYHRILKERQLAAGTGRKRA